MNGCNVIGCGKEVHIFTGYTYAPLCEGHRQNVSSIDPESLISYRKGLHRGGLELSPLDVDERQRYFRLIYVTARIAEIVDTFYTKVEAGFKCNKCDALRSSLKHDKDCWVGKLDNSLVYINSKD